MGAAGAFGRDGPARPALLRVGAGDEHLEGPTLQTWPTSRPGAGLRPAAFPRCRPRRRRSRPPSITGTKTPVKQNRSVFAVLHHQQALISTIISNDLKLGC